MPSPIQSEGEEESDDLSSSFSSPVCRVHITPEKNVDRFSLMQDLLLISHEDDTVTLSVKLKKSAAYLEVDVYMRSHSHDAAETLVECQNKMASAAKRYHAQIVKLSD